jgi:hypothetical protein
VIERRVVETIQRRHFHWGQQLLGVMFGAVLGSFMTLLLLYFLNGTLRFAGESRAADLQLQLDEQTSAIQQSQRSMADEIGTLAGQVADLDSDLAASGEAISAVEMDMTTLAEETAAINEQLAAISLAAEKFDTFMNGLRDLLVSLQGLPPAITGTTTISETATITATLEPGTAGFTPTPEPSPAAQTPEAGGPTRTPRPTATPLIEGSE